MLALDDPRQRQGDLRLVALLAERGPMRVRDLCEMMNCNSEGLQRAVRRLGGAVERVPAREGDLRAVYLQLSPAGRRAYERWAA